MQPQPVETEDRNELPDFEPTDFADVPAAGADAEVDPNWLQLRAGGLLPALYMPPTMNGRRPVPVRMIASMLIGVFMFATTLGVCLTYGPPT